MKKRLLSILMVTAMCATMAVGCGTADDTKDSSSSSKGKSDYLVGFANNSDTYNYCAKFRSYLKDATEAKGISITVTDAGGDTNVQNGQIDDFIVQNANVVSAISNDLDGSIPALEAAKDAGLPYVSFLTSVSGGDDYDGYIYVGSPNEDAGKAQGEYLCDAFPDGASILYFTGAPNDQQYVDRKKGLEEALKKNPNIKILDEYNVENSKDLGMSTAEDSLLSYDKIDAILEKLRDYTVKHFSDEEAYMESIQYKKIFTQKIQHQEFINKLDEFIDQHEKDEENQDEQIMDILNYLTDWLINHILHVDGQIPKEA